MIISKLGAANPRIFWFGIAPISSGEGKVVPLKIINSFGESGVAEGLMLVFAPKVAVFPLKTKLCF